LRYIGPLKSTLHSLHRDDAAAIEPLVAIQFVHKPAAHAAILDALKFATSPRPISR
jgi:hypothetical protein